MSFRSNQKVKLFLTVSDVRKPVRDWSKASVAAGRRLAELAARPAASGLLARRLELEPRSLEGAELRQARGEHLGRQPGVRGRDQRGPSATSGSAGARP